MKYKKELARQLRREQTLGEKKLWGYLRNRKVENLKFRRQHPLKEYIVDFFCEAYGIVIELDGEYHNHCGQKIKDRKRDVHLKALGYKVLRFNNEMVFNDLKAVYKSIHDAKKQQENYHSQRVAFLEERKIAREFHPLLKGKDQNNLRQ